MNKKFKDFELWLSKKGFSPNTVRTYENSLSLYLKEMRNFDVRNQLAYRTLIEERYRPNTVNIRVSALNAWNLYQNNGIKLKQIRIQEDSFAPIGSRIEEADYKKLMAALLDDGEFYWAFLIRFLANTGLRIGEVKKVKFCDLRQKTFHVIGKGGKSRPVFLSSSFMRDYGKYINEQSGPILTTSVPYLRYKLHKFQNKYSIKSNLHPHGFRSLFCRLYYRYDGSHDLRVLQSLMGHSSLKTTARYLKKTSLGMTRKVSAVIKW